jgi:hypothetical protein
VPPSNVRDVSTNAPIGELHAAAVHAVSVSLFTRNFFSSFLIGVAVPVPAQYSSPPPLLLKFAVARGRIARRDDDDGALREAARYEAIPDLRPVKVERSRAEEH